MPHLILTALCVAAAVQSTTDFFSGNMTGWYAASVERSLLGPLPEGEIVWSLRPVGQGMWLLESAFNKGPIEGSHQQFWVGENTLTYCGLLRHYMPKNPVAEVINTYVKTPELSNATVSTYCAAAPSGGCSLFKWTMTVLSPRHIHMNVQLSPPAVHVDFTLTLQSANPDGGYLEVPFEDRKTCQLIASHFAYPWNNRYIPADNIGTGRGQKKSTPATPDLVKSHRRCYRINNATGFTISWTMRGEKVDVVISAKVAGYVAIGFFPAWPGMMAGKIILGGPKCGVQQFVSWTYVGEPSLSNWTVLDGEKVSVDNGVTSVAWSFTPPKLPRDVNFHSNGEVMWAVGAENPEACQSPGYHGAERGVFLLPSFNEGIPFAGHVEC